MRRILIFCFSLILGVLLNFSALQAEAKRSAHTDLAIKIHAGSILDPSIEGVEGLEGTIGSDPNEQSIPNKASQGLDLAFWRIPQNMEFEGHYHPSMPYQLKLKTNALENYQRMLSVADLRSSPKSQWQIKAKLSPLKSEDSDVTIHEGVRLKMNAEAKKHLIRGQNVYVNKFEDDDNGVRYFSDIIIDKEDTEIARTDFGSGKGYTALLFSDIVLEFDAGVAVEGDYSASVEWILSDTLQ